MQYAGSYGGLAVLQIDQSLRFLQSQCCRFEFTLYQIAHNYLFFIRLSNRLG